MHDPANLDAILTVYVWLWWLAFALVFIGGPALILSRRMRRRRDAAPPSQAEPSRSDPDKGRPPT